MSNLLDLIRPFARQGDRDEAFDRRLTLPLVLGSVLNPVNSSMIAVSLIPIGIAFGAPPSETAWLVSGLYLATAVGQPVVGRLVDTFGPRRLYLLATGLVGIAGLVGVLAPSLGVLVTARVLLGIGTCGAYPAAMSLIKSEAQRTGKESPASVLTLLAVGAQTTAAIGPTVGGALVGLAGWRAIFGINIPLSLACLVLGVIRLPRRPAPAERTATGGRAPLDLIGMTLFAAMLTALLLFLMRPDPGHLWLLPVVLLSGAALVLRELRCTGPFLDLRVLGGNRPLLRTYLRQFLAYTASYAFLYGYTQWLEETRGLSATEAGLLLLPMSLVAIMVALLTGPSPRVRGKLVVGTLAMTLAGAGLLVVGSAAAVLLLVLVAALVGINQGLTGLANQNALYHQAQADRMGSSAGLLRTFMYLGAIISSAAVAASFGPDATTPGLHHLALFMLCCSVPLALVVVLDRGLARVGAPTEQPA